jgi:hypothetical protein
VVGNRERAVRLVVIAVFLLCALITLHLTDAPHSKPVLPSTALAETVDFSSVSATPSEPGDTERGPGAVDLYGNEITDAVAQYELDATGSLFELHSPQTELPRLPSPKS